MNGFKTVRFTKLLGEKINVGEWVRGILEQCNFGSIMLVNLGVSFTAGKGIEFSEDYQVQYMYCPKSAAHFNERFKTRAEAYEWADTLKKLDSRMDIMTMSFLYDKGNDFGAFFSGSGWTGRTPIALHLWIQK